LKNKKKIINSLMNNRQLISIGGKKNPIALGFGAKKIDPSVTNELATEFSKLALSAKLDNVGIIYTEDRNNPSLYFV